MYIRIYELDSKLLFRVLVFVYIYLYIIVFQSVINFIM